MFKKVCILIVLIITSNLYAQNGGKAVVLDGKDDYVYVNKLYNSFEDGVTFELYVKWKIPPSQAHRFSVYLHQKGSTERALRIQLSRNKSQVEFSGKRKILKSKTGPKKDEWCLISCVINDSKSKIYLNGKFAGSTRAFSNSRNYEYFIGSHDGKNRFFNGYIDEVRIWNRPLSRHEIESNKNKELVGDEEGLVVYYNFNELTPKGLIKDISGSNNHGILNNGAKIVDSDTPVKSPYPPKISLEIKNKGKNLLQAKKSLKISGTIHNKGKGKAKNVKIWIDTNNKNILLDDAMEIKNLPPHSSKKIDFLIKGKENLTSGFAYINMIAKTKSEQLTKKSFRIPTKALFVKPSYPPDLTVKEIKFTEPSGNKALDAYESGKIQFTLKNLGRGKAQNIHITLSPLNSSDGIEYTSSQIIDLLGSKEEKNVSFNLKGKPLVKTVSRKFRIQITEEFGFDADPFNISFETKSYDPPDLRIEHIAINDKKEGDAYGNGNSIIEAGESIEVTTFIQNYGTGKAEEVTASIFLETDNRNITCLDTDKKFDIGDIAPGDYKKLKFYFYTSRRYSNKHIPLKIDLKEKRGLYGGTKDLALNLGERTKNIVDVQVAKIKKPKLKIKKIREIAKSDVDEPKQKSQTVRSEGLAIIIGIGKYKYAPAVSFAERDAGAFYNTTKKLLGIPEHNIYYITNENATKGEFEKLFSENGWLAKRVTPESEIFVYYSGHGSPEIKTKSAYLIPYDIDPNYANNGYSLDMLYKNLHKLNIKNSTIILDACFVGQSRDKETLLTEARPVVPVIDSPLSYGDITVFFAAGKNEISSSYPKKRHGLFTYYFLKGVQGTADNNADDKINVKELNNYIKKSVRKAAAYMDREQIPNVIGDMEKIIVEY